MRLIDADKVDFREVFKGESDFAKDVRREAENLIDVQPTAYDVDKVVNCLEEKIDFHTNLAIYEMNVGTVSEMEQHEKAIKVLSEAIEIVKAGGKDV